MIDAKKIKEEYEKLTRELTNPDLISDWEKFKEITKKRNSLEKVFKKIEELEEVKEKIAESQQILSAPEDPELTSLAQQELTALEEKKTQIEKELEELTKEKRDLPSAMILEIRAGTGGEEASLFCVDLFQMYSKYATKQGWKQTLLNQHESEVGGFKEVSFEIDSPDAFEKLQYEAGVHRVQRIPTTEKAGRIHTSTATVAVLARPQKTQMQINPADLKIELYNASGPGGQNVNKRETAVRIIHIPTGVVVASQTQRSQQQNRENALALLSAKLLQEKQMREAQELSGARKAQIGTAERAEKIRTYNFPQDRVTDHRVGQSWHGIEKIMEGDIEDILTTLQTQEHSGEGPDD